MAIQSVPAQRSRNQERREGERMNPTDSSRLLPLSGMRRARENREFVQALSQPQHFQTSGPEVRQKSHRFYDFSAHEAFRT